ncbi:hypothetical protein TIFTF001_016775 [Ficus carica]|uniref:Uncharacterized protein n=1 Tax=Ficus carica TaxID=3494 RepID=A0AA88D928_FICCA|nr:hypothetical protein TIFTF001_016775 [Ficus carica]
MKGGYERRKQERKGEIKGLEDINVHPLWRKEPLHWFCAKLDQKQPLHGDRDYDDREDDDDDDEFEFTFVCRELVSSPNSTTRSSAMAISSWFIILSSCPSTAVAALSEVAEEAVLAQKEADLMFKKDQALRSISFEDGLELQDKKTHQDRIV